MARFAAFAALSRHRGLALFLAAAAFAIGLAYRHVVDDPSDRSAVNYLRSGAHGLGIGLAGWIGHFVFAAHLRRRLRQAHLLVELAARAGVMALFIALAAVAFQAALYGPTLEARWLGGGLPLIVALAFAASTVFVAIIELVQLVGGRALVSFVLGTYLRPVRDERILMFLDLAGSTALAERLGELRVHELVTRFFFDIDEPIAAHRGEVHAYVGDGVVVSWSSADGARDAACLRCFFAIEDRIAALAAGYAREFGAEPRFRAGLHAGPVIVAECGSNRRQIAYFGDAVNVAARLPEHAKAASRDLVVSDELLRRVALPADLMREELGLVRLRGRDAPLPLCAVSRRVPA